MPTQRQCRPAGRAGRAVVEVPDLQPPRVVPLDPLAIDRIVPVLLAGDRLAGPLAELLRAVLAVADALAPQPAPAIVGDSLGVRALDDLAENAGDVLFVVGTVDTGDVEIARSVRLARGVRGKPVGMGLVERFMGAVGVHPGEDGQSVVVRGLGQFSVEIPIAQERRAIVERVLAGVIGDDSAGVENHSLHAGAFPVPAPPVNVVSGRVDLGDVGLAPAERATVPGLGIVAGRRLGGRLLGLPGGDIELGQRGGGREGLLEERATDGWTHVTLRVRLETGVNPASGFRGWRCPTAMVGFFSGFPGRVVEEGPGGYRSPHHGRRPWGAIALEEGTGRSWQSGRPPLQAARPARIL